MYVFDKAFASFSLLTRKNLHKNKCTSIDTHILEVDTCCDLWRKNHTSIDTLEIEMIRILGNLSTINCNSSIRKTILITIGELPILLGTSHMLATRFTTTKSIQVRRWKQTQLISSLKRLSTIQKSIKYWLKKLYYPTREERHKDPLSSPELPFIPKALFLLSTFTYCKSILFIALTCSSTMNLLSLVLLELLPSFISISILPIGIV